MAFRAVAASALFVCDFVVVGRHTSAFGGGIVSVSTFISQVFLSFIS